MAGSSATFGFITLGETSLRLEDILYPLLKGGRRPDAETARIIDGLLRDMQAAAQTPDKWL
jgi:alpha-D-ribose 1-methylphosphonate 5-triphosphate synthase subunit PhnG